jgi:uncharacterized protein YjiK
MVALLVLAPVQGAGDAGQEPRSIIRECRYPATPDARWELRVQLREISGLAWHQGSLLAHDDEIGRLVKINPASGTVTKWSSLKGSVHGDFEGLAISDTTAWLMTSTGRLYAFPARPSETALAWTRTETGLGKSCELEGLSAAGAGILLLPCKAGRGADMVIHRWDTRAGRPAAPSEIRVSASALAAAGVRQLRPSAVEWDAKSQHLLVVSSGPAMLLELDPSGKVVALVRLQGHGQPEGIALSPGRDLYVSDEGGAGRASLSRYRCVS